MNGRSLIINADDFGLSIPLSTGIIKAHREGIVTSTSFIVTTDSFAQSCTLAKENPSLDIGVHLVAVGEGLPVLPASQVKSLLPHGDRFPRSWKSFALRLASGQIDIGELSMEFEAQIQRLLDHGIAPSHCDSHQHIHLFPQVAECLLEIVRQYSIPFIRAPKGVTVGAKTVGLNLFSNRFRKNAKERAVPSYGFDFSGHLDRERFLRLLNALCSDGTSHIGEILVHPGFYTNEVSWGYEWEEELSLLTDPSLKEEIARRGATLTSYRALSGGPGAPCRESSAEDRSGR